MIIKKNKKKNVQAINDKNTSRGYIVSNPKRLNILYCFNTDKNIPEYISIKILPTIVSVNMKCQIINKIKGMFIKTIQSLYNFFLIPIPMFFNIFRSS